MADVSLLEEMMGGPMPSIDWGVLAAKNKASVYDSDYIFDYMLPAYERALKVFDSMDMQSFQTSVLLESYTTIKGRALRSVENAKSPWRMGLQAVPFANLGIDIQVDLLKALVYYAWLCVTNGVYAHVKAIIHRSTMSEADIAAHAHWVVSLCNTIAFLNALKVFAPIKKGSTSGLSGLPVVAIVVIAIAAIAALAYVLICISEVATRQITVFAACKGAIESGDPKAMELCRQMNDVPPPSKSMTQTLILIAVIGGGGYALIAFGPAIAQSLRQALAKKEATHAA